MTEERIVETRESNWQLPALIVLGLIAIGWPGFRVERFIEAGQHATIRGEPA